MTVPETQVGIPEYVKLSENNSNDECQVAGSDWSMWWWVKMSVLLVFAGGIAAVLFIWVGPYFMDNMNPSGNTRICKTVRKRSVPGGGFWLVDVVVGKNSVLLVFAGGLAALLFIWVGPYFMDNDIIPLIIWERETFSNPMLALILFATIAIFPVILLPSTPSMWVAGMTYGYGLGFLLIMCGAAIGVSLPYFVGSLFYQKIHGWIEKHPKRACIIKLAGGGNWFSQFRDVTLIRISPFPYIIYNYCAVATDVKYGPYLLGSLVGMVPEVFVAIYTGLLIRTVADASHDRVSLTASQIVFNILGFCVTVCITILITIYAKRRLKKLHKEEPLLLQ